MRGIKYAWLLGVLAVVTMILPSAAVQADSRIVFSSDRSPGSDLNIWKMKDDGTSPTQLTAETGARVDRASL